MCLTDCHHRVLATARLRLAILCQKSLPACLPCICMPTCDQQGQGPRGLCASYKPQACTHTADACLAQSIDVFAGRSDQPALQPQGHMSPAPPAPRLPKPSYSAAPVINRSILAQVSSCLRSATFILQPPLTLFKEVCALLITLHPGCAICTESLSPGCHGLLTAAGSFCLCTPD